MRETLEERYRFYTLRVLIQEMHRKKAEGAIVAGSREEECRRYEREYTERPEYLRELRAAYPALAKALDEITKNLWILDWAITAGWSGPKRRSAFPRWSRCGSMSGWGRSFSWPICFP